MNSSRQTVIRSDDNILHLHRLRRSAGVSAVSTDPGADLNDNVQDETEVRTQLTSSHEAGQKSLQLKS